MEANKAKETTFSDLHPDFIALIMAQLPTTAGNTFSHTCKGMYHMWRWDPLVTALRVLEGFTPIHRPDDIDLMGGHLMDKKPRWVFKKDSVVIGYFQDHTYSGPDKILNVFHCSLGDESETPYMFGVLWRKEGVLWLRLDNRCLDDSIYMSEYYWQELNSMCHSAQHDCPKSDTHSGTMHFAQIASHMHWMDVQVTARYKSKIGIKELEYLQASWRRDDDGLYDICDDYDYRSYHGLA